MTTGNAAPGQARSPGSPHSPASPAHSATGPEKGGVIWITGLSGAGKTTLARALMPHLPRKALLLDGDELRAALGVEGRHFDREGRKQLAFTYARLAGLLAAQGALVVVATISLFHDVHAWNRAHLPDYVEIFLDVPEAVRRERDPKGLYAARAPRPSDGAAGTASPMAGVDLVVEFPLCPTLRFQHSDSLEWMTGRILETLSRI